jgi:SET domain
MAIALASLILWIGFNSSYWAHVLVVAAVPISFLPTLLSALDDRRKEMSPSWGLWSLGDAATLALILTSPGKGEMDLPYIILELICHGAIWAVIGFRSINPMSLWPSHDAGRHATSNGPLPSGSSFKVGRGEFGLAVYANRSFPAGAYLIEFCGPRYHRSEVQSNLPGSDDRFVQIDSEHFMGPSGGMDDLVNHSCDPNAGLRFDEHGIFLVAIKPIQTGEEISWDYSTTSSRSTFFMKCKCGAENCRQVIGDFEFLEPELQGHYRELGLLPPFLQDAVLSRPKTLAA